MIYSQEEIDIFYSMWIRLGWLATGEMFRTEVDVEDLILNTTNVCRQDGRLLKWLLTWIRENSDLINVKKLLRGIDNADKAILGVVLDIAIENGASNNLHTIIGKCKKKMIPEVLFTGLENMPFFIEQERTKGLPIYKKWGLYCSMIQFYDDAQRTRDWILKNNFNLYVRALFGTNIRSEIFYCIYSNVNLSIKNIAQITGYAYSPVYKEVELLLKNGFIEQDKYTWHSLRLSGKSLKLLV